MQVKRQIKIAIDETIHTHWRGQGIAAALLGRMTYMTESITLIAKFTFHGS